MNRQIDASKSRVLLVGGLLSMLLVLPASLTAQDKNEQEEAKELCESALDITAKKDDRYSGISCEINQNGPAYWRCVIERLGNDESFDYATKNC